MTDFLAMVGFEPEACPVCGAPGGNCGPTDGSEDHAPSPLLFEEWGRTDGATKAERSPTMGDVVSTERIWESLPIPKTTRTRKVLRFRAGVIVPAADAKRLNVKADGTQSSVPVADVDPAPSAPVPDAPAPKAKRDAKAVAKKKAPAKKAAAKKR